MPTQQQYSSRIVFSRGLTETELAEAKGLLEQNGFSYNSLGDGFRVLQNGIPAALPTPLNDRIACLPYVLGVFDTPIPSPKSFF